MAAGKAVWGIEIGQCALKAIKLRALDDQHVEAVAFDVIEHAKILSQPDADKAELIKASVEKFASRNDWQGDQFVLGIPGQQTFSRFTKLPPVDQKKIPDIVKFEAGQQIPFDMDDVVWDYHIFQAPGSPDVEVGIFAIRKDLIRAHIDVFSSAGIAPIAVQTLPSALYNFCHYDLNLTPEDGATVVVDVGAQNTDLIIAEADSTWTRNIPLGGNNFTEALIKAFKLSFSKAENLKRTAATSKYARQIFQAMRPVFAELVAEIQRSLGFYSSTHRDVELKRVLALGNAFRLPGLQKYLENNLSIPDGVHKMEKFNRLVPNATINAPEFSDNVLTFGASYGLALQGLELAQVSSSLLPPALARIAVWNRKRLWFAASAACIGLAAVFPWSRTILDQSALAENRTVSSPAQSIISTAKNLNQEYQAVQTNTGEQVEKIQKILELQNQKKVLPFVVTLVNQALPEVQPPELAGVSSADEYKKLLKENPGKYPRTSRRQLLIESCNIQYVKDINAYAPTNTGGGGTPWGGGGSPVVPPTAFNRGAGGRMAPGVIGDDSSSYGYQSDGSSEEGVSEDAGFYVTIEGRLMFGTTMSEAAGLLTGVYFPKLRELGQMPGLGFYVMEKDPQNTDDRQANPELFWVREYFNTGMGGFTQGGMAGMGVANPRAAGMVVGAANDPAEPVNPYVDPVTGEDMSKDWRFSIGFKIKLGDKPADSQSDGDN